MYVYAMLPLNGLLPLNMYSLQYAQMLQQFSISPHHILLPLFVMI